MMKMEKPDKVRIKEISEDILKSMLKRSYPVVDATHFFKKYAKDGKPEHQFSHALQMMEEGGILRIDHTKKPFSVTFVLMEDGKPKMHHMIDDDFESLTFGSMFNDPYEGDKKRVYCYKHIMNDEKAKIRSCNKCQEEINSQICKNHGNVLSKCEKCIKSSQNLKALMTKDQAEEVITKILKQHKDQYWSFGK